MSSNLFRGALGLALPRAIFAPGLLTAGPSGLAQPPRPFVLRARHLDGKRYAAGERFQLSVHLFAPYPDEIVKAFRQCVPLHGAAKLTDSFESKARVLSLNPLAREVEFAAVQFLTPTELKTGNTLAQTPEFPILFARAVARLRTLAAIYAEPLQGPFPELQDQADAVQMVFHSLRHEWAERRSTRTGQTHPLGGFQGQAAYRGKLRNLLPFIHAAEYTGVGRQTVWGKGEIQVVLPD